MTADDGDKEPSYAEVRNFLGGIFGDYNEALPRTWIALQAYVLERVRKMLDANTTKDLAVRTMREKLQTAADDARKMRMLPGRQALLSTQGVNPLTTDEIMAIDRRLANAEPVDAEVVKRLLATQAHVAAQAQDVARGAQEVRLALEDGGDECVAILAAFPAFGTALLAPGAGSQDQVLREIMPPRPGGWGDDPSWRGDHEIAEVEHMATSVKAEVVEDDDA